MSMESSMNITQKDWFQICLSFQQKLGFEGAPSLPVVKKVECKVALILQERNIQTKVAQCRCEQAIEPRMTSLVSALLTFSLRGRPGG